jgi:hypothetical protein
MMIEKIFKRHAGWVGVIVPIFAFGQPAKAAFECPYGIVATTPVKQEEIAKLLPPGNAMDDPDRLNASIDSLRQAGISQNQIVDHLIGAYCPTVVAERDISDVEKTTKVRHYAARIAAIVYRTENELAIIIDVPLKPDIVDIVDAKAKSSGLTTPQWLSQTIERAVSQ